MYCSVDDAFARPLLADFDSRTGLSVQPLFDSEAGKTTGLIERLRAERRRPVADVWWSSEIFGTINLAAGGLLKPSRPASAQDLPDRYRDSQGRWVAFGLRARVIAYDPRRVSPNAVPRRWAELSQPEYASRVALANPQFGTTRGHMAVMLDLWGEEAFVEFLNGLARNEIRIADGNSQSVLMVTRGQVDFAWTDTDDVYVAQMRGDSVALVFPDLDAPDGRSIPGTLWIPNTVGLVAGGPNPQAARRLIEYLASSELELQLARSTSGNIPVRPKLVRQLDRIAPTPAAVDYQAAASVMPRSDDLTRTILLR